MRRYALTLLAGSLLFCACSTKEVYEPKLLGDDWTKVQESQHTIIDTSSNIALLDDATVLTDEGVVGVKISKQDRVISASEEWIISASIDGKLVLVDKNNPEHIESFDLKKTIASVSVSGEYVAVVFADDEIALYDLHSKEAIFKEQEGKSIAVDSRIANPLFTRGLVLFPTLDGKVVFVNIALKKRLRTVIVSSEENFNNVISLNIVDNKIIAATNYTILSMAKKEIHVKYELRNILYDGATIYITTKQGEILSLTSSLQVNAKVKLPFAHFYAMTQSKDKLYILEKEGYMIILDKKSFDYSVHEVDFDEDGYIFVSGKKFYINDIEILTE